MPDQATDQPTFHLNFTLTLTLVDYFELRAFYLRRSIIRNSLIFFGFLLVGGAVIPALSGLPLRLMLRVLERNWTYYALIIVAVFLLVRLLPFLSLLGLWYRGKLPRRMTVAVGEEGVKYTLFDTDVLLHWVAITAVTRTGNAYYISSKTRIVRLAKRDMSESQRRAFETLAGRHVALI